MKKLKVIRGGQDKPLVREKDTFDSIIQITDTEDSTYNKTINNVNTDFCNGYKGGIIAEGIYAGIVFKRDNGKTAIKLYTIENLDKVKKADDVKESMRLFPSLIKNPNHSGQKIITQVLIHTDGENGGYSNGCITIHPSTWNLFISNFNYNEPMIVEIVRKENWKAPKIYEE